MAVTLNSSALITIYGGSGFIGRHVVRAIAKTGARMRVGVRRPELAGHLQPLGGVGQINAVQAKLTSEGLVALNVESTVDQKSPEDIAKKWLEDNDLLK